MPRQNQAPRWSSQKSGCRTSRCGPPRPALRVPQRLVAVAARLDELEVVAVRDAVAIDRERGDVHRVRGQLVVPRERDRVRVGAERRAPGRDADAPPRRRLAADPRRLQLRRAPLLVVGQSVPDVVQRFLVHRFVLEHRERREAARQHRVVRVLDRAIRKSREDLPVRLRAVGLDLGARGPRRRAASRALLVFGVDAALEERLVSGVDPGVAQAALHERVDGEGRQVPLVEADRVAQRDRPRRVGFRQHAVEERQGAPPIAPIPGGEGRPIERDGRGDGEGHGPKIMLDSGHEGDPGPGAGPAGGRGRAAVRPGHPGAAQAAAGDPDRLRPGPARRPGEAGPGRADRGVPADGRDLPAPGLREESRPAPPAHERGDARHRRRRRCARPFPDQRRPVGSPRGQRAVHRRAARSRPAPPSIRRT